MKSFTKVIAILTAFALLVVACGSGGPDLPATLAKVDTVGEKTSPLTLGVNSADSDGVWKAAGTPAGVADAIAIVEAPGERSDDAAGDVFLLYQSGTLWITPAEGEGSAVVYYADNDRAYNRHTSILILNSRWGSRVNSYRSSSSGNGFRGGGGSTGKN